MSPPTDHDVSLDGQVAAEKFSATRLGADASDWCRASIEEVERNVLETGFPPSRLHLIKGKVEDTLPGQAPRGDIAILRLDTDWYASTKHELIHLYPRLISRGVLIIDDYGHWAGARRAVDEYHRFVRTVQTGRAYGLPPCSAKRSVTACNVALAPSVGPASHSACPQD
jgi:O-methyltransferase